jgi:hemolysin III
MPQLPLLEAAAVSAQVDLKPTWRGWIHAGTFPVAIAAGIVLIVLAEGGGEVGRSGVHGDLGAAVRQLRAVSPVQLEADDEGGAQAHRPREHHAADRGHLHPIAVLALPPQKGLLLLALVWSGALLGILFRVFWINARAGCTSRCTCCSAGPP